MLTLLVGVALFCLCFWSINEALKHIFPKAWSDTYDNEEENNDE